MVKSRVILKDCRKCDLERSDEIQPNLCKNISCVNNILHDSQTESRAGQSAEKEIPTVQNPIRKRRKNSKSDNNGGPNEKKMEKDVQKRPKVVSQEVPRRRSPRNTVEAREARAKSRSLRLKDLHYGGEDICGKLSAEKQALAALFLSEINRKLCSVAWKQ